MEIAMNLVNALSNELWSKWVLIALLGTGILVFFATRGIQRKLGLTLVRTFNAFIKKDKKESIDDESEGNISSIQALFTALASTVGVGNIAGVGTALAAGGPGAIFWMWVSAFFGMGLKFAEIVLSVTYREKDKDGTWRGGPMYVYKNGLNSSWAGAIFALFMVIVSFVSLNMMQVSSVANAMESSFNISPMVTGTVLTILTALVIFGGIKRLAKVTEILVPAMALLYCIGGLMVLILNIDKIPSAFALIIKDAFTGQAAVGGFAGSTIMMAARFGVARGLLSNEAGCGTAPMAHSAAKVNHPVEQGLFGISEVFIDTFIVCTFTALVILVTGVWQTGNSGVVLSSKAFGVNLGFIGESIVTIGIALFAYSTLLGASWYGETSITYIFGSKSIRPYRIIYLLLCFIGANVGSNFIFALTDVANGFAVLVNVISVILLINVVKQKTDEYFSLESSLMKKN
ncbi:MAG: sodium:alanine symporter family protein [Sedimentibacter sp.]|uniref:alanine/glycine:cation symporter family protein n=1 Tax=Sedimentibacter sp. TaxID=1960295 RepID=UPI003159288A